MPSSALRIEEFLKENGEFLPSTWLSDGKKLLPSKELAVVQEQKTAPTENDDLEFGMLNVDDADEMEQAMELMLNQFVSDEPLSAALKITREEAEPYFRGQKHHGNHYCSKPVGTKVCKSIFTLREARNA